jgi:hypothetical protein
VSQAAATDSIEGLYRVCVKIYASSPAGGAPSSGGAAARGILNDAAVFVPIFHEWIRDRKLEMVLLDVADYAHAPESPGIMLVAHEVSFAMDRADGRLGLLAQRRIPAEGGVQGALETTLRQARQVVDMLSKDRRVVGKVKFDGSLVRIESNDRLRAPNSNEGFEDLKPWVAKAVDVVYGKKSAPITRVANDPRDRLALDVTVG